jgi:hypothetical protein
VEVVTYDVGIWYVLWLPPQVLATILTALITATGGGFADRAPLRYIRFPRACNTASQHTCKPDKEGIALVPGTYIVVAPCFLERRYSFQAPFLLAVLSVFFFISHVSYVILLSPRLWIIGPCPIEYGRSRKESQCTGGLPDTQDLSVACKFYKGRHIKAGRTIVVTEVIVDS